MPIVSGRTRLYSRLRSILVVTAAAALTAGCQSRSRSLADAHSVKPPIQMLQKPAIDLSKGVAGFPLQAGVVPLTPKEMTDAMRTAYGARLEGSRAIDVRAVGPHLMRLNLLSIDLTGSTVRSTYTPSDQARIEQARVYALADKMRYVASPLKYQNYAASLFVEADRAELTIIPTIENQYTLALSDCRTGTAKLRVDLSDLRKGALAAAKQRQTVAFCIEDLTLNLATPSPRTIIADVDVRARVLFVPSRFSIRSRLDIDRNFNVHFSQLSAKGHDPGGALVAGFGQGRLDKYNDKAAPLVKLSGNKIRLTDLTLDVTDALAVDAAFAGTGR